MKKPMKMTKGSKAKMGPASKVPVAKDMGSMMLAKGGKVKSRRYAVGDVVSTESTPLTSSDDAMDTASMADSPSKPSTPSFGAAFKAARAAGKGVFTWNGKKYSTARADDKPAAKPSSSTPAAKPAAKPAAMDTRAIASRAAAAYDAKEAAKKLAKPSAGEIFRRSMREQMGDPAENSRILRQNIGLSKGGSAKGYARGGGIESRGKTRGKFI